ncbi:Ectonucleotide pyrophosphatase/phosphodiesterase member 6 [Chamberlinius hualienensis]
MVKNHPVNHETFFEKVSKSSTNSTTKLLIILVDGARWDYVYKEDLKGFSRLRQQGVHAQWMVPVFPSVTIPNLYTIATGLYAEDHGMLFNYMHDDRMSQEFSLSPTGSNYNQSQWWEMAEPIWITASEASVRTHVYVWPGCEIINKGRKPHFCMPYHHAFGAEEFREHVNNVIDKFKNDDADFGMVYFEDVDFNGHLFGPDSDNVLSAIHDADQVIYDLLHRLDHIDTKINVIIVSDHGMTTTNTDTVSKHKLDDFIPNEIYRSEIKKVMDAGPITQIFLNQPDNEKSFNNLYRKLNSLDGYTAYKPEEIPEEFHIRNNQHRLPQILVVADNQHAISPMWMTNLQVPFNPIPFDVLTGNHGYFAKTNSDMRGIFLAYGPDFKTGYLAPPINNTDVYNLAMHILNLTPRPNNGSWDAVSHMLNKYAQTSQAFTETNLNKTFPSSSSSFTLSFNLLLVIIAFQFII